jgi:hypothetical protein
VAQHLEADARRSPEFIVGLDFAFSFPAWFLKKRNLASAAELWALVDRAADTWLATCQPPFWGRVGKRRPESPAHFRRTEMDAPVLAGIRPKSVFQIAGAGAVGTGSLRGMSLLHRLHAAGFSIWPFDPPHLPRVVEIYPRLLTGAVNKSSAASRAEYLASHHPSLTRELSLRASSSEDAFDAAVSALAMAAHLDQLTALPRVTDPQLVMEGVIWYPSGPAGEA